MSEVYFAWVDDLYVEFDDAVHAIVAEPGVDEQMHTIRITQAENACAVAELTFPNPGVGLLSASRRRFVLISETDTDNPADAVLVARGRITALPTELQSTMITVEAICGPEDLEDRQRAVAAVAFGAPWSDRLYGDKPDDVVAALNARGATWHIHPATHAVTMTDILTGGRVVDIGSNHAAADFVIKAGDAPVKKVKASVVVDWEQSAEGELDIATSIPAIMSMTAELPAIQINTGAGWEVGDNGYRILSQAPVLLSRGYQRTKLFEGFTYTGSEYNRNASNGGSWLQYTRHYYTKRPEVEEKLTRLDDVLMREFEFRHFRVSYAFRQQRRETIDLVCTIPVQQVLGAVSEVDMGTFVLDDPTDDLDTPVWYPGMAVTLGEYAQFDGKRWLVTETHARTYFYFRSVLNGHLVSVTTPGFVPADPINALDRKFPNLVGRARGTAVIQHALMLMRASLRWSLRGLSVTVRPGDWEAMRSLTLDDELKCHHSRFGDIRGKVIQTTRIWAGSGRYGTVELGVPLGTGVTGVGQVQDVSYAVTASPVAEPVVATSLANRLYSVAGVEVANDAAAQSVLASDAVNDGIDPTNVIANNPTQVTIQLRDLTTVRLIERKIGVTANVETSPMGFDTGV